MAEDTPDITLPLTPAQISRSVGAIVERTFPRPRQELSTPVGEMERRLSAYAGELVQAAYNDAASIARDARERLAKHLFLAAVGPVWRDKMAAAWHDPKENIERHVWRQQADVLLAVITGQEN